MDPLGSLPEPLVRRVLRFVWRVDVEQLVPDGLRVLPASDVARLASVSRHWKETVARVASDLAAQQLCVTIPGDTTQRSNGDDSGGVTALSTEPPWMDVLRTRGFRVLDLCLKMSDAADANANAGANISASSVDWGAVFALLPRLQRLDLSEIPLCSASIRAIVKHASERCRHVRALVLPALAERSEAADAEVALTLTSVYDALREWHASGSIGGLRQVSLPHRTVGDLQRANAEFLSVLTECCPRLQYADGWRATYVDISKWVMCEDEWVTLPSVWAAFWDVCGAELRGFNWVTMPFVEAFVAPFAAVIKPKMTQLAVAFAVNSRWRPQEICPSSVFCRALQSVPALRELSLRVQVYSGEEALDFIDVDRLLSDEVLLTLATHCPALESLSMYEYEFEFMVEPQPLRLVTNKGIEAISSLQHLKRLSIAHEVSITAQALIALVQNMSPRLPERVVELTLADSDNASVLTLQFLEWLSTANTRTPRSLYVRVDFNCSCSVPVARVRSLKEAIQRSHPTTLRFALGASLRGSTADTFMVTSLIVYTASAEPQGVRLPRASADWICHS